MNKKINIAILLAGLFISTSSVAGELLTGKVKLSCEAILCLSTGSPPGECSPSLHEYFSIHFSDFGDTIKGRINFLKLCPVASQTPQMQSLVNAIAHGAGRCDAASLNATLINYSMGMGAIGQGCISGNKPDYCSIYENHEYTDLHGGAHYVIDPPKQQYWPFSMGGNNNNVGMGNLFGSTSSNNQQCGHWVDN